MVVVVAVGLAALVLGGVRMLRRSNAERRDLLQRNVGKTVTLVTSQGKILRVGRTGRIQSIDDHSVVIRVRGYDESIPIAAVLEIWRGRRRLGRW